MKPISRRRQRTFSLRVCVPPLDDSVWAVINGTERLTIAVVDPDDLDALGALFYSFGAVLEDSDAKLAVDLADWLAVGCQRIRWEEDDENVVPAGACGIFHHNADLVFGPPFAECEPLGPSVFAGQIVLPRAIQRAYLDCEDIQSATAVVETFQFIVAHELVHVFDMLKFLAPAFMDWGGFRTNILGQGGMSNHLRSRMCDQSCFTDDCASRHELDSIRHFWPSQADKWFRARDRDWSGLTKTGA